MKNKGKKIIVGLSGGVDSSVSLILLKKAGYEPIGVSFKYAVWKNKKNRLRENICCSEESFAVAREICRRLNIPYRIINEEIDFRNKVIGYFLDVLKNKQTPNPCLICNRLVKFEKLIEVADKEKAEYVATGHYARVKQDKDGIFQLLKGIDMKKDQSYFLALLEPKHLKRIVFPLGNYTKEKVYQIAAKEGFEFFKKTKQSQDLCFIAGKSIPFYLEEELGFEPGEIVDSKGRVIGKHQGLYFYTIGQRKGINLAQGPWWVAGLNKAKNQLVVVNDENNPILFKKEIFLSDYNFISSNPPDLPHRGKPISVMAKTRYNQRLSSAKLYPPKGNILRLVFTRGQKAVTPGQWTVFYQKEVCLGGGKII